MRSRAPGNHLYSLLRSRQDSIGGKLTQARIWSRWNGAPLATPGSAPPHPTRACTTAYYARRTSTTLLASGDSTAYTSKYHLLDSFGRSAPNKLMWRQFTKPHRVCHLIEQCCRVLNPRQPPLPSSATRIFRWHRECYGFQIIQATKPPPRRRVNCCFRLQQPPGLNVSLSHDDRGGPPRARGQRAHRLSANKGQNERLSVLLCSC